jgi:hypothetical protein
MDAAPAPRATYRNTAVSDPQPVRREKVISIDHGKDAMEPPPRMMADGAVSQPEDVHYRTTAQLTEILTQEAPKTIQVEIHGGMVIEMARRIQTVSDDGVNLIYVPPGGDVRRSPFSYYQTTEPEVDIERGLKEIRDQARANYSANGPKTIQTRLPAAPTERMVADADNYSGGIPDDVRTRFGAWRNTHVSSN